MTLDTVDSILDFAIRNEEDVIRLYEHLAERAELDQVRTVFLDFAGEGRRHRQEIIDVRDGISELPEECDVADLEIEQHIRRIDPENGVVDYREALVVAMRVEEAAFKLYYSLAKASEEPQLKETLLRLARQKASHKLRFEIEYDEHVFSED